MTSREQNETKQCAHPTASVRYHSETADDGSEHEEYFCKACDCWLPPASVDEYHNRPDWTEDIAESDAAVPTPVPLEAREHDEKSINCTCLACWRADVKDQESRAAQKSARDFRRAWSHQPTPIPSNASGLWYSEECTDQLLESYSSHVNAALMEKLASAQAREHAPLICHSCGKRTPISFNQCHPCKEKRNAAESRISELERELSTAREALRKQYVSIHAIKHGIGSLCATIEMSFDMCPEPECVNNRRVLSPPTKLDG